MTAQSELSVAGKIQSSQVREQNHKAVALGELCWFGMQG